MNRVLTLILIVLIGANGWYAWYQVQHAAPQATVLDKDIALIDASIAAADGDLTKYNKGLMSLLIAMRIETYRTTKAMLEQKRASMLRGIDLAYSVDGQPSKPVSSDQLKKIEEDLARQEARVRAAEIEAVGSSGLLGMMSLLNAQTERMTAAMVWQGYFAAKYGLPYAKTVSEIVEVQKKELGKIVSDPSGL